MLGKRKRSGSTSLSLPSSASSTPTPGTSPSSPWHHPQASVFSHTPNDSLVNSVNATRDRLRGEVSTRTQKRVRNRGIEEGIHQQTLQKLFTAAKNISRTPTKGLTLPAFEPEHRCEDCETPLEEHELYEESEGCCVNCRRKVCRGCSVEVMCWNGGQGRMCLGCSLR